MLSSKSILNELEELGAGCAADVDTVGAFPYDWGFDVLTTVIELPFDVTVTVPPPVV